MTWVNVNSLIWRLMGLFKVAKELISNWYPQEHNANQILNHTERQGVHSLQRGIDGTLTIHISYLFYIILVVLDSGLKHIQSEAMSCHITSNCSSFYKTNTVWYLTLRQLLKQLQDLRLVGSNHRPSITPINSLQLISDPSLQSGAWEHTTGLWKFSPLCASFFTASASSLAPLIIVPAF
jgi:hypothetical protein